MENNQNGNSGPGNRDSQDESPQGSYGHGYNQNDPNQRDSAKFSQDNDDFTREEDNMDNERNMTSGSSESSAAREDQKRHATGTNDMGRSQSTNTDEDALNSDWNKRNL